MAGAGVVVMIQGPIPILARVVCCVAFMAHWAGSNDDSALRCCKSGGRRLDLEENRGFYSGSGEKLDSERGVA